MNALPGKLLHSAFSFAMSIIRRDMSTARQGRKTQPLRRRNGPKSTRIAAASDGLQLGNIHRERYAGEKTSGDIEGLPAKCLRDGQTLWVAARLLKHEVWEELV